MAKTLTFDTAMAALGIGAGIAIAWLLGRGAGEISLTHFLIVPPAFLVCAIVSFLVLGIHRQVWRHIGVSDAIRTLQGVGLSTLLFLAAFVPWQAMPALPIGSVFLGVVVWALLLLVGRMVSLSRTTERPFQLFQRRPRNVPKVVLVGDSQAAANVLRHGNRNGKGARVRTLGLVTTEETLPGRAIRGVPVLGDFAALEYVLDMLTARYEDVPWVAVTGGARRPELMNQVLEVVARKKTKVMALAASDSAPELIDLRPADLLERPEHSLDMERVAALVSGSRVLVTGGGGSIGLELARQCAALGPESLTLFDSSEYNLYRAENILRHTTPDIDLHVVLGSVRDTVRLDQVFAMARPEIVIHAAALKHVPLMEANACEAVLTNIGGAVNVSRAAAKARSKRLVFISTDKAVDPYNVMGATKRAAEIAVGRATAGSCVTPAMVRFGNVLGSSGSVVARFSDQIDMGGPVTVTHPDASRYFMTGEEAAALVLQASALQDDGEPAGLYVLDMGEPVRIEMLAEALIRMRGLIPGTDIEIVHTGLRPGEKLVETLTYGFEDISRTLADGVLRVHASPDVDDGFDFLILALLRAAEARDRTQVLNLLKRIVPEFEYNPQRIAAQTVGA